MTDLIITGASRGIGRALALALAAKSPARRLVLTARDTSMLDDVARQVRTAGGVALCVAGDLSTLAGARTLGARLAVELAPPAILVHNAGVWPSRRELTSDGLERAFAVNCVGPLLVQQPLLERKLIDRVMVISAGLLVMGRYADDRTPTGKDFSRWRTYCTTKLAFAVAERDIAEQHPDIDFVVLHPGVVRTDLGAQRGVLGALLGLFKRAWETPEACAARLTKLLDRDRWSPPGQPRWLVESDEKPWPRATEHEPTRRAVRAMMRRYLSAREEGSAAG